MYLRNRGKISFLIIVLCGGLSIVISAGRTQQNTEAKKLKNPVESNDESIEEGKKLYQRYCASCHGPKGKGDGAMALAGGTPSDLTDEKWDYGSTDGEIFVAIRDGVSADMLAYKDKLSEEQIWHLVNFIRSIGPESQRPQRPQREQRKQRRQRI